MAILKHLPVHNRYYQDAVTYFLFQHDEHARPIYNERHKMILRNNVLIDAINTDVWSYSVDCQIANRKWHKNQEERDVKSHHIIISFPKVDRDKCGLTPEIAQEIGMEFARKHFGGHQCIVATHDDGNNHSGNIHLHVAFNSLRIKDTDPPEYSDLARDYKAGYKFQASGKCIRYLKADLERMCRERGLSQIPLNRPAKQKITNEEYWAEKRGQERLDQKNEAIRSIDGKPTETKFQTELSRIRKAIDDTKAKCFTVEEFMTILKRDHSITVTESRGRWSYLPVNRQRPITWRRLGDDYSKEAIEAFILQRIREQQEQAAPEKKEEKKPTVPEPKPAHPIIEAVTIGRIIDLNDPKIKASYGLTQWAKIQNLKTTSQTVNYLTENHLLNMDKLSDTITDTRQQFKDETQQLLQVEARLKDVNLILKNLGVYHKFRPLYQEYLKARKSPKFRENHIREILLYEGARKFLREYQNDHKIKSFPAMQTLRSEKAELTAEQQLLYERRKELKQSIKVMEDSCRLLTQIEPERGHAPSRSEPYL
ncbi:MAG: relaxase/mobilization nuclease domain-containing protein [Oscillospiraceae bacterium]|nr:relaxase/mobilization nuclease domain-containing protein [Oscillospiraceae bacterium]